MKRFTTFSVWLILVALALLAFAAFAQGGTIPLAAAAGGGAVPLLCFGFVSIRGLFARDVIIQYLEALGPVEKTRCMDTVFTNRPQQAGPLIGRDIVRGYIRAMALSQRGGPAINIAGNTGQADFYQPLPIKPKISVNGVDLNNLRLFMQGGPNSKQLLAAWARGKTDILRRTVRATTEPLCAVALTGKLVWPVALEGGGYDTFSIDYGDVQTLDADSYLYWDDPLCGPVDILKMLIAIAKKFQRKGVGGRVAYWAGEAAFMALFTMVSKILTSTKLRTEIAIPLSATESSIVIGTVTVELVADEYQHPQTGVWTPVVPTNTLKAIALDAGHMMPYASIDDLDGNLEPMPLFIKPIKNDEGQQSLLGESKPLPIVNTDGICDVVVLTPAE